MRLRALAAVLLVSLPWQAAGADMAGDAQRLMRYWYGTIWAQDFTQGDTLELDLTCDGSVERVFAWRDGVNPEKEVYNLALIARRADPLPTRWETLPDASAMLLPLDLEVGTGDQFALCDNRQKPYGSGFEATVVPISDRARKSFGLPPACREWLRIDDGMCDAIYVGYDPEKGMFVLDRN